MTLHRVVIERIPKDRQRKAMPTVVNFDERIESQRPVSSWMDLAQAIDMLGYLKSHYPILLDDTGAILIYSFQSCEWSDGSLPPPPAEFDLAAVGRAHVSFRELVMPTGPQYGVDDWEAIAAALKNVKGDGERHAKRLLRSIRGHIANLKKKDERFAAMTAPD